MIVLAGLDKKDGLNLTTESLINLVSSYKNVYVVAGVNINYEKKYLGQLEKWIKKKKVIGVKLYTGYPHEP